MMKWVYSTILGLAFISCQSNPESGVDKADENASQSEIKAETIDLKTYEQRGGQIAKAAFVELSGNLKAAMREGGPDGAVDFCNIHALDITQSVADSLGVEIRRASSKNRNPENAPTDYEKAAMRKFEETLSNGEEPRGYAAEIDGKVRYFQPIITQPACLNCHGEQGVEINESTWRIIREKYPDDKAYGYALNEIRGIWSITFKEEKQ